MASVPAAESSFYNNRGQGAAVSPSGQGDDDAVPGCCDDAVSGCWDDAIPRCSDDLSLDVP